MITVAHATVRRGWLGRGVACPGGPPGGFLLLLEVLDYQMVGNGMTPT
jgi:hypothetical protein